MAPHPQPSPQPSPDVRTRLTPAPLPQAPLDAAQRLACLRLIRSDNVGPVTFRELINHFGGADAALAALRAVPGCEAAAEIGEVRTEPGGMVLVETSFGGRRVMDQLVGDPLPRIC